MISTVEVDIDAWCAEYGDTPTVAAVRESVRSYFDMANVLPDHLHDIVEVIK